MGLIDNLARVDSGNEYDLFTSPHKEAEIEVPANFTKTNISARHYSLAEQWELPALIKKRKYDLVHFPHYNIALLNLTTPFIVTVFDLIKHKYPQTRAQQGSAIKEWIRYRAYRFDLWYAMRFSRMVVTGTEYVKNELMEFYGTRSDKIRAIPLGINQSLQTQLNNPTTQDKVLAQFGIKQPYLIYVGNAYAYKNIAVIIRSLAQLPPEISLIIVGARHVFEETVGNLIEETQMQERIQYLGFVPDEELGVLYNQALAFVSASLEEGFGIPPIEAMTRGCPVILSDIPAHREVCGEVPLFFPPHDVSSLVENINVLHNDIDRREQYMQAGKKQAARYNFQSMAQETLDLYEQCMIK